MEFKRLSDVEVVAEPAESANVLIEENGVIKKAPKTAVGGAVGSGGGETPDMVITINQGPTSQITADYFTITEGSVADVFNTVREGRYPLVKVKFYSGNNDGYMPIREVYDASVCLYGENLWVKVMTCPASSNGDIRTHSFYMSSDGVPQTISSYRVTMTGM